MITAHPRMAALVADSSGATPQVACPPTTPTSAARSLAISALVVPQVSPDLDLSTILGQSGSTLEHPSPPPAPHLLLNTRRDSLIEQFLAAATTCAALPAVITPRGGISFRQLANQVQAVASALRVRRDFVAGDRVAILLENGPEYIAAFYGVLLAGGVAVPLPPDSQFARLDRILHACDAHLALTGRIFLRRGIVERFCPVCVGRGADLGATPKTSAGELAVLMYTSGSTGEPKGVMLSHRNLLANAASICEALGITAADRALGLLPFYHAFGNSVLQTHLLSGGSIVCAGSLAFPQSILDAAREYEVTSVSGVPEVFRRLQTRSSLALAPAADLHWPPARLRYFAVAGGALPADAAVAFAERVAPVQLYVMYGQTEATARLSCLDPAELSIRAGSIGRGLPGVVLEVVDDQGQPVAPGEIGEIRATGDNIMLGYWQQQAASSEVVRNGWLYTGDLAKLDTDGFIFPEGRRNQLLKVHGFRIHPRELEQFAVEILGAAEAVAVGVPREDGETSLALFLHYVSEVPQLSDVSQLRRKCAAELPRHFVPDCLEIVDEWPLNDALKVDRQALLRRAAAALNGPSGKP